MPVNVFLLKPKCSGKTRGHYKGIIRATGGFLCQVKNGLSSVENLEQKIKDGLVGTSAIGIRQSNMQKREDDTKYDGYFVVSDIDQDGNIDVSAPVNARLFNPEEEERSPERQVNEKIWKILKPKKGNWTFKPPTMKDEYDVRKTSTAIIYNL